MSDQSVTHRDKVTLFSPKRPSAETSLKGQAGPLFTQKPKSGRPDAPGSVASVIPEVGELLSQAGILAADLADKGFPPDQLSHAVEVSKRSTPAPTHKAQGG